MLIEQKSHLFAYAITRDFGFAPNPFHGFCTLATCKPGIRGGAKIGDWVLGVGGCSMGNASRKCILLMKVTEIIDFQRYWEDSRYTLKKPLRNGSRVQMLGDNIYHKDHDGNWIQEDSHHSNPDGTRNPVNLKRDTDESEKVLISHLFLYFGDAAIPVDLDSIGYHRIRNYLKINLSKSESAYRLVQSTINAHHSSINMVISDPCQFMDSHKRADQGTGKVL